MKKLFVVLALAGMVGSVSASTIATVNGKSAVVSVYGDKKDKKKKKKDACCSSASTTDASKSCSKDGAKTGCCKDKKKAEAAPAK